MNIPRFISTGFALLLVTFAACCLAQSPPSSPSSSGASSTPSSALLSSAVRLIAIDRNGHSVTDLKPEDLRLLVGKQDRKILSVSSPASLPKTIGIFIDKYRPGPLPNKAIAAIQGFLNSVWQEHDVGFLVSVSDKIYQGVPPTSDLAQIEDALSKILELNDERWSHLLPQWNWTPTEWEEAVSSAPRSPQGTGSTERVYVVLSGFYSYGSTKSRIHAVLTQQARIFSLLAVSNPQGGAECPSDSDGSLGPCYLTFWKEEHIAKSIAKETGGDEFTAETRKDLARAQARLASELRSTYLLTYEPLPPNLAPGKVKILCNRSDVRLLYASR